MYSLKCNLQYSLNTWESLHTDTKNFIIPIVILYKASFCDSKKPGVLCEVAAPGSKQPPKLHTPPLIPSFTIHYAMPRPLCSPTQWKGPVPFQRPSDVLARMLHLLRSNTELERALDLARHFKSKSVLRGEDVLMCSWQVLQQTKLWLWAEWCRVSKFTIKIISFW